MDKKLIYLDNNATTKVDDKVFEAMLPYFKEEYGNPSSIYEFAKKANYAVKEARGQIKDFLNAENEKEIIFTSLVVVLISKVNGCSGNSFKISNKIFAGIVIFPSSSKRSNSTFASIVVSLSEAVAYNIPSVATNKILSKIGCTGLPPITLLTACNRVSSVLLDTTNFINTTFYY